MNKQKKMNLFIYQMYFLSQHQILMLTLNYFEIFKKMVQFIMVDLLYNHNFKQLIKKYLLLEKFVNLVKDIKILLWEKVFEWIDIIKKKLVKIQVLNI